MAPQSAEISPMSFIAIQWSDVLLVAVIVGTVVIVPTIVAGLWRAIQRCGAIITTPILSGLHHRYVRI
jgi:hypothetical protein